MKHGTYSIEPNTKKKKGLTKKDIEDFFQGKMGTLMFKGKNRRQRRK